jgi:hypothetical protein
VTTFYSRDIALCDFHLFGPRKKRLAGKRFTKDADVKQAATSWLQTLDTHFFYTACNPCCYGGQRDAYFMLYVYSGIRVLPDLYNSVSVRFILL